MLRARLVGRNAESRMPISIPAPGGLVIGNEWPVRLSGKTGAAMVQSGNEFLEIRSIGDE